MPSAWGLWGARRYISLYRPGQPEDVFPYYRPAARWTALRSVRVPTAVVIGGRDEYLDRRAGDVVEVFRRHAVRAPSFTGEVLAGAPHDFQRRERELTAFLIRWVRQLPSAP